MRDRRKRTAGRPFTSTPSKRTLRRWARSTRVRREAWKTDTARGILFAAGAWSLIALFVVVPTLLGRLAGLFDAWPNIFSLALLAATCWALGRVLPLKRWMRTAR